MTLQRSIVFAGGATGGHLFPGIAVAQYWQQWHGHSRTVFIGSARSIEGEIVARYGFEHVALGSEPSTSLATHPLRFLRAYRRSICDARRILSDLRPDVVVGLGGFASVPVVVAASKHKIPVVLLEQNTVPGRATRWLSRRAVAVCLTFDSSANAFRSSVRQRCELTGNPVRAEIAKLFAPATSTAIDAAPIDTESHQHTLLILGGSQGAVAVNQRVVAALRDLDTASRGWRIVHQTGDRDAARVRADWQDSQLDVECHAFLDNMAERYAAANVVVSRAGATTLAELACAGCPAILIPYPGSVGDHQVLNARAFESAGAALVVEQNADVAHRLRDQLAALLTSAAHRSKLQHGMLSLARPEAAGRVADVLRSVIDADHSRR